MPHRAEATFTVDHRDNTPLEWPGATMARGCWSKTFAGEVSGTSVVELIFGQLDGPGSGGGPSVYVAVERFECSVHGDNGTFVLVHSATSLGDDSSASWTILDGSGTDDLAGINGSAEITPEHGFVLTYNLDGRN